MPRRPGLYGRRYPPRRFRRAPVLSSDGQAQVLGIKGDFPLGEFYALQTVDNFPAPPIWTTVVGQAYRLVKSVRAPSLAGSTFAVNYLDTVFQVNAFTFDYLDRTRLLSHGVTMAASGGISYPLARKLRASVDAFYTPLWVRRAGAADHNDGLFNIRGLVAWQFR